MNGSVISLHSLPNGWLCYTNVLKAGYADENSQHVDLEHGFIVCQAKSHGRLIYSILRHRKKRC